MPMRDLLRFLDLKLNDLMLSLYRNRQALMTIQQRVTVNPAYVGPLREALASLHEAERTLADIQQHVASLPGTRANATE